jgi:HSP90 family molecular chaperone
MQPDPVDYELVAQENVRRYGTEWPRIGGMLLADRYVERTHFIYELLQNAEDALRKRSGWSGSRSVKFEQSKSSLRVSHFGKQFDEPDVRGICGISESSRDLTAIGRFGIGFKSVYAFTDRPEIHSGAEDFAIEGYIRPVAADLV